MKILFTSSEVIPYAKSGGLADVSGALPKALETLGAEVVIIMPKYKSCSSEKWDLEKLPVTLKIPVSGKIEEAGVYSANHSDRTKVYFVEKDDYYHRDALYQTSDGDYKDNAERFVFFSRAVLETAKAVNFKPDILHLNDWQTAMASVFLKAFYKNDPFFDKTASVLTIHNLGYQGLFWHYDMHLTNLPWDYFTHEMLEFWGKLNFLKGGIVFSDIVTTVSERYSKEIQTEEYGFGLDGVLKSRKDSLFGILNGVDYNDWNPETDELLPERYSSKSLKGKAVCKSKLQEYFKLPQKRNIPVIGMITRLTSQKGLDILMESLPALLKKGKKFQMVILGTGDEIYHNLLREISGKYPDTIAVKIGFDNTLAHLIEAGSDMFLMPSKYEPCGLNQMYSLKYGTVPVVRATGGLDDTVRNFNPAALKGNGFKFSDYSGRTLSNAILKALKCYEDKNKWNVLVKNIMDLDFSWESSARKYLKVYKTAIKKL